MEDQTWGRSPGAPRIYAGSPSFTRLREGQTKSPPATPSRLPSMGGRRPWVSEEPARRSLDRQLRGCLNTFLAGSLEEDLLPGRCGKSRSGDESLVFNRPEEGRHGLRRRGWVTRRVIARHLSSKEPADTCQHDHFRAPLCDADRMASRQDHDRVLSVWFESVSVGRSRSRCLVGVGVGVIVGWVAGGRPRCVVRGGRRGRRGVWP